jgi:hypothetical protein
MNWKDDLPELPGPTVEHVRALDGMTDAATRGMLSNPIYTGIPPFSQVVSDAAWVHAAAALIREDGPEQFLVNLLHVLRSSMADVFAAQADLADDMDDTPAEFLRSNENGDLDEYLVKDEDGDLAGYPWQAPLEGLLVCSHDDLPMLFLDGEYVCVAEYLFAHLADAAVVDVIDEPVFTLVFQNGHTLPLYCPHCGESLHIDNESSMLEELAGSIIDDVWWQDEEDTLTLEFSRPAGETDQPGQSVTIHLNSVRGLTCPEITRAGDPDF